MCPEVLCEAKPCWLTLNMADSFFGVGDFFPVFEPENLVDWVPFVAALEGGGSAVVHHLLLGLHLGRERS